MRTVLRATTTAKRSPEVGRKFGLDPPGRALRRRMTSSGTEPLGRRPPPPPPQSSAGRGPPKPPTCVGRLCSKPAFRGAEERSPRNTARIERAAPGFDKAPAKRGDPRRSIRGRYLPFAGDTRRRYLPPDVLQVRYAGGAVDAGDTSSGPAPARRHQNVLSSRRLSPRVPGSRKAT